MQYIAIAALSAVFGFMLACLLIGATGGRKRKVLSKEQIKRFIDDMQDEGYRVTGKGNVRVSNAEIVEYLTGWGDIPY